MNVPIDILTSREHFFSDEERKHMTVNLKKACILVTPLKSMKAIGQRCKKYNLSSASITAEAEYQREREPDLNETVSLVSKSTETLENASEDTVGQKSKNKEDWNECDFLTLSPHIKIRSPKNKQMGTLDLKNARLLSKLEKTENQVSVPSDQSFSDLTSEESEEESKIRRKVRVDKTRARRTKEAMVQLRKTTGNTMRVTRSEMDESDTEYFIKQKKAKSSAKETVQKSNVRNALPVVEGSDKTKRYPLEYLPGLNQDEEWNEKELHKLHW